MKCVKRKIVGIGGAIGIGETTVTSYLGGEGAFFVFPGCPPSSPAPRPAAENRRFKSGILVIDAALLFGWKDVLRNLDYTILVTAPTRLKERRSLAKGIDKDTFWHIINVQKKERDMAKYADFIIRNTGTIADLKKQC